MAVKVDVEEKIKISPSYDNDEDIQKISDVIRLLYNMANSVEWKFKGEADNIRYIAEQLDIITADHYYNLQTEEDEKS
jgi:hypothetical protein